MLKHRSANLVTTLTLALTVPLFGVSAARADPAEIPQPLGEVKNEHDTIRLTVEKDKVPNDQVEIVLVLAPALHWHKKAKAFNATGAVAEIEVRDDTKVAKMTLQIDKLDRVEFGKGAIFNTTHWDYKISDFRMMGGCRITVSWEKD